MEASALAATTPMRLLLVHPGADWATSDVFEGYAAALRDLGHEVGTFNLNVRIARAAEWLHWNWKKARAAGQDVAKPNHADTLYLAGSDVVAAALRGDVDWVVIFTGAYLHPDLFILLRRAGRRVALVMTESPYEDDAQVRVLPHVDVAFCNERTSVERLRRANPNVVYLPPSYDPTRHHSATTAESAAAPAVPAHDVVFVGTGFHERLEALAAVDWSGIDLGLYGSYELLGSRSSLRRHIRGGVVSNAYAAALYRSAAIGLNLYRRSMSYARGTARVETAESVNPRALELAACGVYQISDRRDEAAELFGDLVPMFTRPDELEPLIRRALADPAGRQAAARALPARVAAWTFARRARHVAAFLWSVLAGTEPRATSHQGVA